METFYITIMDVGSSDYEIRGFYDEAMAEQYASVRGNDTLVQVVTPMSEAEAKQLINDEAKERREEERFDRMRDEGEI